MHIQTQREEMKRPSTPPAECKKHVEKRRNVRVDLHEIRSNATRRINQSRSL